MRLFLRWFAILTLLGIGVSGFMLLSGHDVSAQPKPPASCAPYVDRVRDSIAAFNATKQQRLTPYNQQLATLQARDGVFTVVAHPTCFDPAQVTEATAALVKYYGH